MQSLLVRRGWRASAEQIQFRNTMITDLTPDEETLLADMKPKWRYNIRLAERRGVVVRDGTAADLPAFYRDVRRNGRARWLSGSSLSVLREHLVAFLAEGLAHLLLAELEGELVAGLILFRFGETAWYFYGASTAERPGCHAQPRAAVGGAALGQGRRLHPVRLVGRARQAGRRAIRCGGSTGSRRASGGNSFPGSAPGTSRSTALSTGCYTAAMPRLLDLARRRHRAGLAGRLTLPDLLEPRQHGLPAEEVRSSYPECGPSRSMITDAGSVRTR